MKKFILIICAVVALSSLFCSCKADPNTLIVGATANPHAQILQFVKEDYEALGYKLKIKIYTDYVMPNTSLASGDLHANFFQHLPYLENFNKEKGTNLVSACAVHYEPMAIFGKNISSLSQIAKNAKIIIPTDASNQSRALLLLAEHNIITLSENANVLTGVTLLNVVNNNGYNLIPVDSASAPAQLNNADNGAIALLNGNYALASGYDLANALAIENSNSETAIRYANVLAVKAENLNDPKIQALVNLLTSEKVKEYIISTFNGAVLPV